MAYVVVPEPGRAVVAVGYVVFPVNGRATPIHTMASNAEAVASAVSACATPGTLDWTVASNAAAVVVATAAPTVSVMTASCAVAVDAPSAGCGLIAANGCGASAVAAP